MERDRTIRPRPERRVHLFPPHHKSVEAKVVCHDCGQECVRETTGFECACGFGFTVQWDRLIARGVYLGRIQLPQLQEVTC